MEKGKVRFGLIDNAHSDGPFGYVNGILNPDKDGINSVVIIAEDWQRPGYKVRIPPIV